MTVLTCPPMHGDAAILARLLLVTPVLERAELATTIIDRAKTARVHVQCYGKAHPEYGNGSIMSAAMNYSRNLPTEPFFSDKDYIDCWIHVMQAFRALARQEELAGQDQPHQPEFVEAAE